MKKFLLFACLALIVVGCEKKKDQKAPIPVKVAGIQTNCDDEINNDIQEHGDDWCDDTDIYTAHKINKANFNTYRSNRWGNDEAKYKTIYWYDIKKLIGVDTCYSKYVQFVFTPDDDDNASINIQPSNCFYRDGSCYSAPLLRAIAAQHSLKDMDEIECTIAKNNGNEIVIFRINNRTLIPSYSYFDVSDFPKFVKNKLLDH
jgi:hypothetical protein